MFKRYLLLTMLMASICAFCLDLSAEEIQVPITSHALITNGLGQSRILVNISLPPQVNDSNLVFAELLIPITPQMTADSILRIDCYPVTSAWNPQNVAWSGPWQRAGGDYDTTASPILFATTNAASDKAYFDLTRVIKSWLGNIRQNHGLIFMIPNNISSRFGLRAAPNLPTNAIGTLKIVVL